MNIRSTYLRRLSKFILMGWKVNFICVFCLLAVTACSKSENLTLRNEQYPLNAVGNSGLSGTVFVSENLDSSFNVTVKLNSSVKDTIHIMNIYNPGGTAWGTISAKLVDIPGTGGPVIGETKNIKQIIENTGVYSSVTYDEVIRATKTLKVFLSANNSGTLLAEASLAH